MSTHPFYFKLVYTCHFRHYHIDPRLSLIEIYNQLKPLVKNDFRIEYFDIIIAGHRDMENAPVLRIDERSLNNVLHGNLMNSFYIKPRRNEHCLVRIANYTETEIEPIAESQTMNNQSTDEINLVILSECPICYSEKEETNMINPYNCEHKLCSGCYSVWSNRLRHNCPMCRANLR